MAGRYRVTNWFQFRNPFFLCTSSRRVKLYFYSLSATIRFPTKKKSIFTKKIPSDSSRRVRINSPTKNQIKSNPQLKKTVKITRI
ncbi:hypothetical protein HanPI659440_Chr11g0406891 [Helianthus annuus]|nr:hypothetical protein HanPI659440_Chr11g0406891 [Helianthus annuus]